LHHPAASKKNEMVPSPLSVGEEKVSAFRTAAWKSTDFPVAGLVQVF
jgi:hypothetical protein